MPPRGRIEVSEQFCKGCELCLTACVPGVLALDGDRLTPKGYHPAALVRAGLHRVRVVRDDLPGSSHHRLPGAGSGGSCMSRQLWKGNEAVAEASIRAGLQAYFGYPITPQTELLEWMARRMPEEGRVFLQAESELAAINMVYGAACAGARTMTSSSSPGISLMMEGLSYIAGTEVPMVLVDVMRGGPGLGNIAPAQADYNQIVHGGTHGDFHPIVLAPASVQEAVDLTGLAFELAEQYRNVAVVLTDGALGQMMEPAELPPFAPLPTTIPDWAVSGSAGRERRYLSSINMDTTAQENANLRWAARWETICAREVRYKGYFLDGARFLVVGFGSAGRIALTAVRAARARGHPGRAAAPDQPGALPLRGARGAGRTAGRPAGGRDERRADAGGCAPGGGRADARRVLRPAGRRGAFPR